MRFKHRWVSNSARSYSHPKSAPFAVIVVFDIMANSQDTTSMPIDGAIFSVLHMMPTHLDVNVYAPALAPMFSVENYNLWCLIDGDSTPFKVSCTSNTDINDLKKLIHKAHERQLLHNVDATNLVLWKVRYSSCIGTDTEIYEQLNKATTVTPAKTLAHRVRLQGEDISTFSTKLEEPSDSVSEVFGGQPAPKSLHIIVQAPSGGQHSASSPLSILFI